MKIIDKILHKLKHKLKIKMVWTRRFVTRNYYKKNYEEWVKKEKYYQKP